MSLKMLVNKTDIIGTLKQKDILKGKIVVLRETDVG